MTNVVNLKPSAKGSKSEAALIRACVEYAQAVGATEYAYSLDPDGDKAGAAQMSAAFERKQQRMVKVIASARATSAGGLKAKARAVEILLKLNHRCCLTDEETALVASLAQDVKSYLEATADAQPTTVTAARA